MIRQIMYAEESIPMKQDAVDSHLQRRGKYHTDSGDQGMPLSPSMASYDMPVDGEEEKESENK